MSVEQISVAIATRNRPRELARCLDALLKGSVVPAEVLVVDQSTSGRATEDAVAERRGATSEGVEVVYVRQSETGLSASRNAAARRARHAILAVTDDDCVPDADWVRAIVEAFASAEEPDAVSGRVLPLGPDTPGTFAVSSRRSTARELHRGSVAPWLVGTGANFAVARSRLDAIGGYDERLGAGSPGGAGEDIDVLHRLLRSGCAVLYEPAAMVYHERQPRAARRASRGSYGLGIGACCALWLRAGDAGAIAILMRWIVLRARLLVGSLVRGDGHEAGDELRVMAGTARGLLYGAFARARREVSPRPAT